MAQAQIVRRARAAMRCQRIRRGALLQTLEDCRKKREDDDLWLESLRRVRQPQVPLRKPSPDPVHSPVEGKMMEFDKDEAVITPAEVSQREPTHEPRKATMTELEKDNRCKSEGSAKFLERTNCPQAFDSDSDDSGDSLVSDPEHLIICLDEEVGIDAASSVRNLEHALVKAAAGDDFSNREAKFQISKRKGESTGQVKPRGIPTVRFVSFPTSKDLHLLYCDDCDSFTLMSISKNGKALCEKCRGYKRLAWSRTNRLQRNWLVVEEVKSQLNC